MTAVTVKSNLAQARGTVDNDHDKGTRDRRLCCVAADAFSQRLTVSLHIQIYGIPIMMVSLPRISLVIGALSALVASSIVVGAQEAQIGDEVW